MALFLTDFRDFSLLMVIGYLLGVNADTEHTTISLSTVGAHCEVCEGHLLAKYCALFPAQTLLLQSDSWE